MEMQSLINKIILCIIVNVVLVAILYNIPVEGNDILENLCVYKLVFGKECWNCGMTRAFLSVIHGDFPKAMFYNSKVIVVFPICVILYAYSWYKYIRPKNQIS